MALLDVRRSSIQRCAQDTSRVLRLAELKARAAGATASGTHATGGLARRQLAAITSGSGGDVFVPARDKSDVPPIGSAVNPELGLEIAAARPVAREA